MIQVLRKVLFLVLVLAVPVAALAQDAPESKPQEKTEARPTGLPSNVKWTVDFDAGWGTFGFANSLFNNPKEPGIDENLSDQWFEGYIKPALSANYTLASGSELFGKVSVVGERTYGSVPEQFGYDVSSFGPEELNIGWRSGTSLEMGDNVLEVVLGRVPFKLGHGLLLWDGSAEGGSRGGFWTNARKAFEFGTVARFVPGPHRFEMFYLDKDEMKENDSKSKLWGMNYEFTAGKDSSTTLGATYMKTWADAEVRPGRDGMNVFNVRAYTAPVPTMPDLSFEFELANERNGDAIDSDAWTLQGAYQLSAVMWKPKISYRYAFFQGDDPQTTANEAFDPLFLGFYDWGTWWQGEIAGEYFLSNSNLKSHMVRVHVTPNDKFGGGLIFFNFRLDHPESYGPHVTDTDVASEIDAYADWKLSANFTLSLVGAYADPGKAVQQYANRTKNFAYGMAYLAYAF